MSSQVYKPSAIMLKCTALNMTGQQTKHACPGDAFAGPLCERHTKPSSHRRISAIDSAMRVVAVISAKRTLTRLHATLWAVVPKSSSAMCFGLASLRMVLRTKATVRPPFTPMHVSKSRWKQGSRPFGQLIDWCYSSATMSSPRTHSS